jgi:prokaryotic YEATS domain
LEGTRIEPHRITKPIQLMAVWFVALLLIDSAFLAAAFQISTPSWVTPTLVIAAITFVPLFLTGVFLMQTVFRNELQEDPYYSEFLKRKEETFKNFSPENIYQSLNTDNLNCSSGELETSDMVLETKRAQSYEEKYGLFLVHNWRPSFTQGQVADVVIWLHQHGKGPLTYGTIEKVEYQLGPKFFDRPKIKTNHREFFRLEVSAYGPMLCVARVFIKNIERPLLLERYINFDDIPY